jgi:hypothetical protein
MEPPKIFSELQAITRDMLDHDIALNGGAAVGASSAPAADGAIWKIPTGVWITIGVGAAAIAIGAGGGNSTTNH